MQDKSTITYWLRQPGEDSGTETDILVSEVNKVPEIGERLRINTFLDMNDLSREFSHLSEKQIKSLVRKDESQIRGEFVVVDVKRWLKIKHESRKASDIFQIDVLGSNGTSMISPEIPSEYTIENFEVYIEPFRHTELTETPIAKVRNSLGSIFGMIDMLSLIGEHPDKEKELLELFKDSIKDTKESMARLRELIGNDKNWR